MTQLKLGTRKSLLAWAQSSWVAREVERLNPGVRVELVGIETRGDRIQDVALSQINGKEFFVAELDHALGDGSVDFTVHSMKDLSLDRPAQFVCAAIPRRENPRDVILFGPGAVEKLVRGGTLRIGTSSPRRLENIPPFLKKALPHKTREPVLEWVEIRGNVNTRLSRVHEAAGSERRLDGVVLAFAGLIRLWNDGPGREELARLFQGVRWMVLPLRECPAAPAQGALAVECRAEDARVRELLAKLHDPETERRVARERDLLREWGGGCHQRFGATAFDLPTSGATCLAVRGSKPDGEFVDELRWPAPGRTGGASWDGSRWRAGSESADSRMVWSEDLEGASVFVTHSRAVDQAHADRLAHARVWTSGTSSWFKLAALGVWVEGCAEGLGFGAEKLEPVLGLSSQWTVLTHRGAASDWANASRVISTYRVGGKYGADAIEALKSARNIFWTSGSQLTELAEWADPEAHHACGPGKTAARVRAKFPNAVIFPSAEEWRKWTQTPSR